jgi:hypothetical protein
MRKSNGEFEVPQLRRNLIATLGLISGHCPGISPLQAKISLYYGPQAYNYRAKLNAYVNYYQVYNNLAVLTSSSARRAPQNDYTFHTTASELHPNDRITSKFKIVELHDNYNVYFGVTYYG